MATIRILANESIEQMKRGALASSQNNQTLVQQSIDQGECSKLSLKGIRPRLVQPLYCNSKGGGRLVRESNPKKGDANENTPKPSGS